MTRKNRRHSDIIILPAVAADSGPPNMPKGTAATLKLEMGEMTVKAQATGAGARLAYGQITNVENSADTLKIRYKSLRAEDKTLSFTVGRSAAGGLPVFANNIRILAGLCTAPSEPPAHHITL